MGNNSKFYVLVAPGVAVVGVMTSADRALRAAEEYVSRRNGATPHWGTSTDMTAALRQLRSPTTTKLVLWDGGVNRPIKWLGAAEVRIEVHRPDVLTRDVG